MTVQVSPAIDAEFKALIPPLTEAEMRLALW